MLPKISSTIHTHTTSSGEKILFTQFTGAHEKSLLEAKESEDDKIIIETVLDVLKSIVRKGNIETLPTFDVEFLLLKSRIVSVGSDVDVVLKDPETGEKVQVTLDLSEAKLSEGNKETRIKIGQSEESGQEVWVNFKYPTFLDLKEFNSISDEAKIRLCLDSIQEGETYHDISDASDEDLTEWLMSLEKSVLKEFSDFIDNIPKLTLDVKYTLKDGTEKTITLKDFKDFFM